jgi:hypothetical protein
MRDSYDFAIFGSGPLAALLAGLLAHDHGKRVIRIAEPASPQRLPRNIDIALPLATRPEAWRLLCAAEAETLALFAATGAADAIVPTTVRFVADRPDTQTALAHMFHVALGYGRPSRDGVFAGVPRLVRDVPLAGSKVRLADSAQLQEGRILIAGEGVDVGRVVLADDHAILDWLPEPPGLDVMPMTATLTAPTKRLAATVMRYPDRSVTLLQRTDLAVLALVASDHEAEARLASTLPGPFPLHRRATSRFRRLLSRDGAPVIGPHGQFFLAAGLGDASAFLAPPLARFLSGKASPDEQAWFAAHAPDADRSGITDFVEAQP